MVSFFLLIKDNLILISKKNSLFAVIMSMGVPPVIGTGTTMLNHMAVASVLGVDNPQDILAYVLAFEWMM